MLRFTYNACRVSIQRDKLISSRQSVCVLVEGIRDDEAPCNSLEISRKCPEAWRYWSRLVRNYF